MSLPYTPAGMASGSSNFMVDSLLDPSFSLFPTNQDMSYPDQSPMPSYGMAHSPSPMYDDLMMHYFSTVSRIQFVFAGSQVSEVTYNVRWPPLHRLPFC